MLTYLRRLTPFFLILLAITFIEAGITLDYSDARSRSGGRSFKRSAPKQNPSQAPAKTSTSQSSKKSSFAKGLLGGAIGGLLLGGLFGMGGSGMGILPILLLGGVGYFLYRRFSKMKKNASFPGGHSSANSTVPSTANQTVDQTVDQPGNSEANVPPPVPGTGSLEEGVEMIIKTDPDFDISHFKEVASDVFFQVQAGWMRRDLSSYRHLLGEQLIAEYERHFDEMRAQGQTNKLESIAIRKVEVMDAGNDGEVDFVTILFKANLLDYTVDDKTGDLVEGSMTDPVKFAEKWTWARPVNTENWKLEGLEVVSQ